MKIIGLMPVRNEDWVLGFSARAALQWCDLLMVGLHACTDRSEAICNEVYREFPGRITIATRHESGIWNEMAHRHRLLEIARQWGATHIVTIDADEVLTANLLPTIRERIEILSPGEILSLPWLAVTEGGYLTSGPWANQQVTLAFEDNPRFHWSAELRNGYDYHRRPPFCKNAESFLVHSAPLKAEEGGILHLQFLSRRRLKAKQALYQMQEVIRWPGMALGEPCDDPPARLAEVYGRAVYGSDPATHDYQPLLYPWWEPYSALVPYLHAEAEPWQEAECKRLWAEYGPQKFKGLDLFGVVGG